MDEPKEAQQQNQKEEHEASSAKRKASKTQQPASEIGMNEILLFNKYSYNVEVHDLSLKNYINLKKEAYPNTFRRNSKKDFS